jgi:uncharacterized protein YndB with AHSA1/START domain
MTIPKWWLGAGRRLEDEAGGFADWMGFQGWCAHGDYCSGIPASGIADHVGDDNRREAASYRGPSPWLAGKLSRLSCYTEAITRTSVELSTIQESHMPIKTCPTGPVFSAARRQAIAGGALVIGGFAMRSSALLAAAGDGVSHSAGSIHQEPSFNANRQRVYEALTDTKQFDKVTQLSGVMKSMSQMKKPTQISRQLGGAFTLFGGYIVGRHIELVPNELIVQAWRTGSWDRGIYSIVRFQLAEQGAGTRIMFDHTGFPSGEAEHLAAGWQANYWTPIDKLLS